MALEGFLNLRNTTTSNVTLGNASGGNYGVSIYPSTSGNFTLTGGTGMGVYFEVGHDEGDVSVTDFVGFESLGLDRYVSGGISGSPGDLTVTDFYHFRAGASSVVGSGTKTLTNNYGFYFETDSNFTNQYAFFSANDTAKSRVGTIERYRETINSLTSSSTITVDCGLGPIHKVTLATNTGFVISNLGTGQSVTLIITQDGTGSGTGAFASTKFAGGTPTLSTDANAIDVVTIFNDGSNKIATIAKAFA